MQQVRKLALNDLGFQTVDSLVESLRLEADEFDGAVRLVQDGYPYDSWREPKRSGNGSRLIEHPIPPLKRVQSRLNRLLQRLNLPVAFQGCRFGTSILTNAEPHRRRTSFLALDLADYYLTIRPSAVFNGLRRLRMCPEVAQLVTRVTTTRYHVPQGAPTSPIIAAIALLPVEERLRGLLASIEGVLTIYGDNISISSPRADLRKFAKVIHSIIRSEGFRIRIEKTVFCSPSDPKPLPGLLVKDGVIEVRPDDLAAAKRVVDRCIQLAEVGLRSSICCRLRPRLGGVVRHLGWINSHMAKGLLERFNAIPWPTVYLANPCRESTCSCLSAYFTGAVDLDRAGPTTSLSARKVDFSDVKLSIEHASITNDSVAPF